MSEYSLALEKRELTGKKLKTLRDKGLIPSVIYGKDEPILAASAYNATEKVIMSAGYHSPIDLNISGAKKLAIVKTVHIDPVSRRIINIEFQSISANEVVEATTPIVIVGFGESDASKLYHFMYNKAMEEIDIKAKPADLPKELTLDASKMSSLEDKLTIKDLIAILPQGVEIANKELEEDQVIISLYDPAAEAAAREAEDKAAAEAGEISAADVPSDNGSKPEESAEAAADAE